MAHIGIVACSAEGATLCYRTICAQGAELLGPHAHPEMSMHGHSLAQYVRYLRDEDWQGVAELMLSSAQKLALVGADFLICPDNTIHAALPIVLPHSPLPWMHIAEVVAEEAVRRGFTRVGITGTMPLLRSDVYPQALSACGITYVLPDSVESETMDRIIFDELVYGTFTTEAISFFQNTIARMKAQGCDAVVLGCTEIPLIISDANSPLPVLDSTRLLATAALRRAVSG